MKLPGGLGGGIPQPQIAKRLVPLLDVLFLLLAFFIIMPHGMRSVQQQLAPPPDWTKQEIQRLVEVSLDADGLVKLGGNPYTIAEIEENPARLGQPDEKVMVLLRVSFSARLRDYRKLVDVLEDRRLVYVVLQEPPR